MKILAIDTSAVSASVAVCDDEKLLAEYTLLRGNTHSETILPMVDSLLASLGLTVRDLDLFAVSAGPGSFTGVRIGVSTVKGLAYGSGKPCVGVSTLEALAANLSILRGALICPVMNARRNQVYTALFSNGSDGSERLMPDSAIPIVELDQILSGYSEPIYLCGDGYELVRSQLHAATETTPERLRPQSACSVAQVALRMALRGETVSDAELSPVYLRPCQAERERLEREQQANKSTEKT